MRQETRTMEEEREPENVPAAIRRGKDGSGWSFLVAMELLPFVIMLHLYVRNYQEVKIWTVLGVGAVVAVVAGLIFGSSFLVFRNTLLSFCLSLLTLAGLFLYRRFGLLMIPWMPRGITLLYLICILPYAAPAAAGSGGRNTGREKPGRRLFY